MNSIVIESIQICIFFCFLNDFLSSHRTNLIDLRTQYKDKFEEKHGVKLGFMSCFVKVRKRKVVYEYFVTFKEQ